MEDTDSLYGLIGHPLNHSFSKQYFSEKFIQENRNNSRFLDFDFPTLTKFKELIDQHKNLKGLSVTIPHKKAIIRYMDAIDPIARSVGAINCIKVTRQHNDFKLTGYNTDIIGFERSFIPMLKSFHRKALILGTGGAAQAVAFVLEKLKIDYIFVSRKPAACKQIRYEIIDQEIMKDHSIIINTTPLGMFPDNNQKPSIPYKEITKQHYLFDLIYNPEKTKFLTLGEEQGAQIKNGFEMLQIQAVESWKIWNSPIE